MLKAELKVVGGKQTGHRIALPQKFLIGREQDCQLRPNSDLVSRHHCVFTLDDYTLRLRDLGSTNGTFVNNEYLEGQTVLETGDRVRVGNLEFEVVILKEAEARSEEPKQEFVPDHDSRIIAPGVEELPSSETLVDVALPTGIDNDSESPTESFAGSAEVGSSSDTDTIPTYPPAGYPAPPGMPPQGYYPPPPGYYPPPGMPYPPPGYPPYYPQQQQGYPLPQSATPPPATRAAEASKIPDVRLPDPSETGVKDVTPGSGQGKSGDEPNPSDKANELLNKMKTRR
jgi:pSer/pThr/pTyr-binding forkhead associated (FHA) protein